MFRIFCLLFVFLITSPAKAQDVGFVQKDSTVNDSIYSEGVMEELPEFPGGMNAFYECIKKNIKFPKEDVNGTVYVSFVVEKDGSISNVDVLKGIPGCMYCDKEAKRVISVMPKWKAGRNDGKNVRTKCAMPIKFHLI